MSSQQEARPRAKVKAALSAHLHRDEGHLLHGRLHLEAGLDHQPLLAGRLLQLVTTQEGKVGRPMNEGAALHWARKLRSVWLETERD